MVLKSSRALDLWYRREKPSKRLQMASGWPKMRSMRLVICLITIKTGTRPGALENTQLQHYKTMGRDPVNGDPVMHIPEHKWSVDGPATLSLDEELVDLLAIYVEHIHPQFPSPRDDYLFLQTSGKRFTNGTINKRLPEMWLRSDVRTDLRVTATNIRKCRASALQENKIEGAELDGSGVRIAPVPYPKNGHEFLLMRRFDCSCFPGSSHNKEIHRKVVKLSVFEQPGGQSERGCR